MSSSDALEIARIARAICTKVADDLGDFLPFVESWTEGLGAPPPSELYDENPTLATGALIVRAATEAVSLVDLSRWSDGGEARLAETLKRRLVRSRQSVPPRNRNLMSSSSAVAREADEIEATLRLICHAAAGAILGAGHESSET